MSLQWLARGLRGGTVTSRYPARPEEAPPGFRGRIEVLDPRGGDSDLERLCPTGAISVRADHGIEVDRGRCVLCGACVEAAPERFAFEPVYETAAHRRELLLAGDVWEDDLPRLRESLGRQVRALRRSVHIRHVDAGSDGSEEWEIQALLNPYYDIHRLGLYFTAAPRHADVLLVTGGVTEPMRAPLERAFCAMPEPKAVVAAGTDACSGGLADGLGTVAGGVDQVLPVDVYVPGSPPAPIALLHGLLLAVGVIGEAST
jgi:Ni,Fe-hydrogenase III small subunit/ferredoxin